MCDEREGGEQLRGGRKLIGGFGWSVRERERKRASWADWRDGPSEGGIDELRER